MSIHDIHSSKNALSLSPPHIFVFLLANSYRKVLNEVKTWPRFHFPVNKEKYLIISTYSKGVGNRYLTLLLEYKMVKSSISTKVKKHIFFTQQSHFLRIKPTEKLVQVFKVFVNWHCLK